MASTFLARKERAFRMPSPLCPSSCTRGGCGRRTRRSERAIFVIPQVHSLVIFQLLAGQALEASVVSNYSQGTHFLSYLQGEEKGSRLGALRHCASQQRRSQAKDAKGQMSLKFGVYSAVPKHILSKYPPALSFLLVTQQPEVIQSHPASARGCEVLCAA